MKIDAPQPFHAPTRRRLMLLATAAAVLVMPAAAQTPEPRPSYSLYGTPGLIDMPTAESAADADLATTIGGFRGDLRTTLTFQAFPWLSGSFRYSGFDADTFRNRDRDTTDELIFDRSFDLRLRLLSEGYLRPAVTVGLTDLAGTGKISSEYVVATKHFTRNIAVTGGLGWGRFGSNNSLGSIGDRPDETLGEGGVPSTNQWFRGDVAPFGGVAWQASDRITVELEYSSDAYDAATQADTFDREIPVNVGVDYRFDNGTRLSAYALYGSEVGAQVTFVNNPRRANVPGGLEEAPLPVLLRSDEARQDTSWVAAPPVDYTAALREALQRDGLVLEGLALTPRRATLRFENPRFGAEAQALGRAARMMARTLPGSVEVFELVPVANGMALSRVTVRRSDIEAYEFRAAEDLRPRVAVADAFRTPRPVAPDSYPDLSWAVEPYLQTGLFDPDIPIRADVGVRARAAYRPTAATEFSGAVSKRVVGNLADTPADNSGALPPVRTNFPEYLTEGDPGIEHLTFAAFGRPGESLFSRVTVGYLESMFGGVSGEVLWKPVGSRLGIGAEMNWVQQRDFDRRFGFRDYDVATGHVSGYYELDRGLYGQVDVGRYLAGDVGATFTATREFDNGWSVGAFATFTDVSAEEFGEGSFDKGIILRIPTSWVLGTADRSTIRADIRPILRNGGARLNVRDRLYQVVRDYDEQRIDETFGRFWR